jgi:hypothetical protein
MEHKHESDHGAMNSKANTAFVVFFGHRLLFSGDRTLGTSFRFVSLLVVFSLSGLPLDAPVHASRSQAWQSRAERVVE